MQKDMKNSVRVLFKEDDVPSPTSNPTYESNPNGEEPATPPPHRPLVSDEWGSSNHKYLDANITWSAQDKASAAEADDADVDGGEESDNNATARPSTDGDRSETGAQGQENQGNAADPSHHFILCNGIFIHLRFLCFGYCEISRPWESGEENETFFRRVWKPFRNRLVLKTLRRNPKGKAQRGQYLRWA